MSTATIWVTSCSWRNRITRWSWDEFVRWVHEMSSWDEFVRWIVRFVHERRSCSVDLLDRPPSLKECPPLRSEWLPVLKESNHKLDLLCEVSGFLITGIEPMVDLLCEMSGFLITGIEPQVLVLLGLESPLTGLFLVKIASFSQYSNSTSARNWTETQS